MDGGKGDRRRPGAMPPGACERIFGSVISSKVICTEEENQPEGQPTDDEPGREESNDMGGNEE